MLIIGITGSMAIGKSSLVHRIRKTLKWPIWDADAEIQKLYKNPIIISEIIKNFPKTVVSGTFDRQLLRQEISETPDLLRKLEAILYPHLSCSRQGFLRYHRRLNAAVVVLDIPLLFEKNLENLCDVTIVVKAPIWLQRQRIMKRSGMTKKLMESLLGQQMPQIEKLQRADIIIDSGLNHHHTWNQFMVKVVGAMK